MGSLLLGMMLAAASVGSVLVACGMVGVGDRQVRVRLRQDLGTLTVSNDNAGRARAGVPARGVARLLTPPAVARKIERQAILAGRPEAWPLARILAAKVLAVFLGSVIGLVFIVRIASTAGIGLGLGVAVFSYFVPDLLVLNRAKKRQTLIQDELPDILDQVTISIEAGLGFESALARAGERGGGPMAEEVVRTVQDIRLGMSRRDAYQALAERSTVDDLRRFTKSIVQAEEFGIPISTVVRTQATEMRMKRRQRAEGRALKVPVKLLFPLIVCIMPVLFIVILAPALMNAASSFSGP